VKQIAPRYDRLFGLLANEQDVQDTNRDYRTYRLAARTRLTKQLNTALVVTGNKEALEGIATIEDNAFTYPPNTRTGQRAVRMMDTGMDEIEGAEKAANKQFFTNALNLIRDD